MCWQFSLIDPEHAFAWLWTPGFLKIFDNLFFLVFILHVEGLKKSINKYNYTFIKYYRFFNFIIITDFILKSINFSLPALLLSSITNKVYQNNQAIASQLRRVFCLLRWSILMTKYKSLKKITSFTKAPIHPNSFHSFTFKMESICLHTADLSSS